MTFEFRYEAEMFNPVSNYLKNSGFKNQLSELQFYDYSIDLYTYSAKKRKTVAIELKLTQWKRAVEQALVYQLCSDFVYIALPSITSKKVELNFLRSEGIGLIAVYPSGVCRKVLAAKSSKVLKKNYVKKNLSRMKAKKNG